MHQGNDTQDWTSDTICFFSSVIFVALVGRFAFFSLADIICLFVTRQKWIEGLPPSNYFLWKHMFDFVDNHDKCRKSCFFRQKIRSIFSPFWSILRPIWSILTLFNAKALFLALWVNFLPISSLCLHFLATGCKDSKICATLFVTTSTSIVYFKYFVMSCLQSKPSPLPLSNHCLNRYSTFSPSRPSGRIQIQYK